MKYGLCVASAVEELERAGVDYSVELEGKHPKIIWYAGDQRRIYCTSRTPSDYRAPMNTRHEVRRMLREDGYFASKDVDDSEATLNLPRLFIRDGGAFCSSREVAHHFGKQHKNVLQSIDGLLADCGEEFGRLNFQPSSYVTQQGKSQREFNLSRDGFTLLAMGFTGREAVSWKIKYLDAFNAMETELRRIGAIGISSVSFDEVRDRLDRLEGDLSALADLTLLTPKEGYSVVKAHYRKQRGRAAA